MASESSETPPADRRSEHLTGDVAEKDGAKESGSPASRAAERTGSAGEPGDGISERENREGNFGSAAADETRRRRPR